MKTKEILQKSIRALTEEIESLKLVLDASHRGSEAEHVVYGVLFDLREATDRLTSYLERM